MDFISDGWREEIEETIENAPIMMSGSAYTDGFKDGLKKALEIIENHI